MLTTITSLSSITPIILVNAPVKIQEKINGKTNYSKTNNLENLNREKRSNNINNYNLNVLPAIRYNNYNLNIRPILQQEDYWCGPAIGEAVLRHYIHSDNTNYQFQNNLANLMNTNNQGKLINDWITGINHFISSNHLNHNRTYSRIDLDLEYNDNTMLTRFYNIVSHSSQNDVPVAFMYHGSRNLNEEDHSHFILITGIRNHYNNVIYTYIDPWTGT